MLHETIDGIEDNPLTDGTTIKEAEIDQFSTKQLKMEIIKGLLLIMDRNGLKKKNH